MSKFDHEECEKELEIKCMQNKVLCDERDKLKSQLHQYQSKTVNVVAFHRLEDANAELQKQCTALHEICSEDETTITLLKTQNARLKVALELFITLRGDEGHHYSRMEGNSCV